jgi:hypothetical protein
MTNSPAREFFTDFYTKNCAKNYSVADAKSKAFTGQRGNRFMRQRSLYY